MYRQQIKAYILDDINTNTQKHAHDEHAHKNMVFWLFMTTYRHILLIIDDDMEYWIYDDIWHF